MKIRNDIIELAISQARKSPMKHRHGSVIWKSNQIIGAGYNWPGGQVPSGGWRRYSIHSERDALKGIRLERLYGASLICVRLSRSKEQLSWSKPCDGCVKLLKRRGLRNIFWFDSNGTLNRDDI